MVMSKITGTIVVLTLLVLLWCLIGNAYMIGFIDRSPVLFLTFFVTCVFCFYFLTKKTTKIVRWIGSNKKWMVFLLGFAVILSVLFRFSFTMLDYQPVSDPASFYANSSSLATEGELMEPGYVAKFPYLYTYNVILSFVMELIGTSHVSVIVLNLLLDILAAVFLYLFMRNNRASRLLSLAVATIWMTNPFTVLFSVLSLPIALFDTLLVLAIYLIHQIYLNVPRFTSLSVYSVLAGLTLALANSVRPLAVIFVIGLLIFFTLIVVQNSKRKILIGNLVASWLIVAALVSSLSHVQSELVSRATGYPETKNAGGWSLFVGTNLEYYGAWNYDDAAVSEKMVKEGFSPNVSQEMFRQMAVERFNSYSPLEQAELIVGKALVLGGDQKSGIYNLDAYPAIKANNDTYELFKFVAALFSWIVLTIGTVLFYRMSQQKGKAVLFVHYLALVFIGLFFASLLVEVASRYFAPFLVILVIFMGLVMKAYVDGNKPKAGIA